MESKIGLIAKLTKKQTDRYYFSDIPIGTYFIIVGEEPPGSVYDLIGYFLNYPPQYSSNDMYHYIGLIEIGSWEIVGTIEDNIEILNQKSWIKKI